MANVDEMTPLEFLNKKFDLYKKYQKQFKDFGYKLEISEGDSKEGKGFYIEVIQKKDNGLDTSMPFKEQTAFAHTPTSANLRLKETLKKLSDFNAKSQDTDEFGKIRAKYENVGSGKFRKDIKILSKHRIFGQDTIELIKIGRTWQAKIKNPVTGERYQIPTDSYGNITDSAAIIRFLNVEEGDRQGKIRSPLVDVSTKAKVVAPDKSKNAAEVINGYLWYEHPNESDFTGVDVPGSDFLVKSKKGGHVMVIGTKDEQERVGKIITDNFTKRERDMMKNLIIEIKKTAGRGVAGYYQSAKNPRGEAVNQIVVGKNYIKKSKPDKGGRLDGSDDYDETLTHEIIHFLRDHDPKRSALTKRVREYKELADRDVEETFTDAETVARMKLPPHQKRAGYHQFIKQAEKDKLRGDLDPEIRLGEDPSDKQVFVVSDKQVLMGATTNGKLKPNPVAMKHELQLDTDGNYVDYYLHDKHEFIQGGYLNYLEALGLDKKEKEKLKTELDKIAPTHDNFDRKTLDKRLELLNLTKSQRKKLLDLMYKNKRGLNAVKAVDKNYPALNISKVANKGRSEAVDTYWKYVSQGIDGKPVTVNTHTYSPTADVKLRELIDIAVPDAPANKPKLQEWRDGRIYNVPIPKNEMPPKLGEKTKRMKTKRMKARM